MTGQKNGMMSHSLLLTIPEAVETEPKTRASKRNIMLPDEVLSMLAKHRERQGQELKLLQSGLSEGWFSVINLAVFSFPGT